MLPLGARPGPEVPVTEPPAAATINVSSQLPGWSSSSCVLEGGVSELQVHAFIRQKQQASQESFA